ncbi:hypothetical protein COMNV_00685 [Commensalibacter sp. Nvir]|nr:hypothetical protein COMNV_00685 [Commensalibacter sp. Nvir]
MFSKEGFLKSKIYKSGKFTYFNYEDGHIDAIIATDNLIMYPRLNKV